MSRTDLRRLLLIAAAAFVLRAGAAVLTEFKPLFPPYYYTDARMTDDGAAATYAAAHEGRAYDFDGTVTQHVQVTLQAQFYRLTGPRPFLVKIVNCAFGAAAVALLGLVLLRAFPPTVAFAAALLCAAWPSNVFYTSQNLKESPTEFLAYGALLASLALCDERLSGRGRAAAWLAALLTALLGCGLYRSYVLLALTATVAAAFAFTSARRRRTAAFPALGLAVALAGAAAYRPVSRFLLQHFLLSTKSAAGYALTAPQLTPGFVPRIYENSELRGDGSKAVDLVSPTSPEGITRFRNARQYSDQRWASYFAHREIETQIFPDAKFSSWLDVLTFAPKGAFYALFMPLPGLYPMAGKLGRWMAGLEDVGLLALAVLGLAGAVRGPRTPARGALLVFFLAMTAGSSLFEFDLGSAGRHKILYLPMLFPFAAEELMRLLGRKESV